MQIDPEVARRIRLLALDVDGVLTDNGIWIGPIGGERVELKRFDIQDVLGLVLLRTAGLPVVWLSGRHSEATALDEGLRGRAVARFEAATLAGLLGGFAVAGPLFTLFKALTAMRQAAALYAEQGVPAVAVFWVDAEDHDWDEVKS